MTTYEKTWQYQSNLAYDNTTATTSGKNAAWSVKAFLKGDYASWTVQNGSAASSLQGFWTTYYSCDGTNVGTAGDGIDRWGAQGPTQGNTGTHGSFTTGATIPGAIRFVDSTANLFASTDVGNYLTITGAATSTNNSPTGTPFKIVNYVSASTVDILNPGGSTTDANNGTVTWTERTVVVAASTTIASGSNGQSLPQATINVASTAAFPSAGTIFIQTNATAYQAVTYTGTNGTQFTGCSGGTGSMTTGNLVATYGITNQNAGTAHTWYVLKSPTALGPYYIILDCNTTNAYQFSIILSKQAPTGGTTTARPTATDEVNQWQTVQFINTTNNFSYRWHGSIATDGCFNYMTSYDGNGSMYSTGIFQVPAETKSIDTWPGVLWWTGGGTRPFIAQGINSPGYFAGRNRNGAIGLLYSTLTYSYGVNSAMFSGFYTTTDFTDGYYDDLPIYLYNQTAGYKAIRGRWIDIRWGPGQLAQGTVESSQSSITGIYNGNCWMPYNSVPII